MHHVAASTPLSDLGRSSGQPPWWARRSCLVLRANIYILVQQCGTVISWQLQYRRGKSNIFCCGVSRILALWSRTHDPSDLSFLSAGIAGLCPCAGRGHRGPPQRAFAWVSRELWLHLGSWRFWVPQTWLGESGGERCMLNRAGNGPDKKQGSQEQQQRKVIHYKGDWCQSCRDACKSHPCR